MGLEENKPEIVTVHIYDGKLVQIWSAYQADKPENYTLGRSRIEAVEAFQAQPVIESGVSADGKEFVAKCPKFKDLEGRGVSRMAAEKELIRRINLLNNRVDWKSLFFIILLEVETPLDALDVLPQELKFIRDELWRREQAEKARVKSPEPKTDAV